MVGGKVVDIWIWREDVVEVCVEDLPHYPGQYAQVFPFKNEFSLVIKRGDSVWWQMGHIYWTPQDGSLGETRIRRRGLSISRDKPICTGREKFNAMGEKT